jgi:hypothetical protein
VQPVEVGDASSSAPLTSAEPAEVAPIVPPVTLAELMPRLTDAEVRALAADAGWPTHRLDEVVRVSDCESRHRPHVVGAAGERGVMQIHPVHRSLVASLGYAWDQVADTRVNLAVARAVFVQAGRSWRPWSCRP